MAKKQTRMVPIFCEVFGNSPAVKTIDFLITGRAFDYTISDISRGAGIGRTTLYKTLENLQKEKIIIQTRKIGHSKLYRINQGSEKTELLVKFYLQLLDELEKN